MTKYLSTALIMGLTATLLLALPPTGPLPALAQVEGREPLAPPAEEMGPGVASETGRDSLAPPQPSERTGRSLDPACPPPDERTGRGRICRPAEELPRLGAPEAEEPLVPERRFGPLAPRGRAAPTGPLRPTGPASGDRGDLRSFGPDGSFDGVPGPYGPGQNGRRGGP